LTIRHCQPLERIVLGVPVIAMVLAATAVPVEPRSPTYGVSGFGISEPLLSDVLTNILGYVPVGIVLGDLGPFRAVAIAGIVAK
jgi:hypothetical protein